MLSVLTLLHFSVDGVCAAVLASYALAEMDYAAIVFYFSLYNLIAFGGQWLAGLVLDRKTGWIAGSFAVATGMLGLAMFQATGIMVQTILLGLGNCIFHVAGGSLVLRSYDRTFRELGIFVSSGAIGLALGLNSYVPAYCFWLANLLGTMWLLLRAWPLAARQIAKPCSAAAQESGRHPASSFALLVGPLALLLCVVLRGFAGSGDPQAPVLLFPLVFATGKVLGGLVCDWCGYRKTVLLIFVTGCIALQLPDSLFGLALLTLAFNMTMPLTLRLLHWGRVTSPGAMFGLAAGCLLPGAFFSTFFYLPPAAMLTIQFLGLLLAWRLLPASFRPVAMNNR